MTWINLPPGPTLPEMMYPCTGTPSAPTNPYSIDQLRRLPANLLQSLLGLALILDTNRLILLGLRTPLLLLHLLAQLALLAGIVTLLVILLVAKTPLKLVKERSALVLLLLDVIPRVLDLTNNPPHLALDPTLTPQFANPVVKCVPRFPPLTVSDSRQLGMTIA